MGLKEELEGRSVEFLRRTYGDRARINVDREGRRYIDILDLCFQLEIDGRMLNVLVELSDAEGLRAYVEEIQKPEFWERTNLTYWREKRKNAKKDLEGLEFVADEASRACLASLNLRTDNPEKAFDVFLNYVLKPFVYFRIAKSGFG